MDLDISPILSEWPLSPDQLLTARIVTGDDGRPKVQLRIPLGLLQMETDGRPDGSRPHGQESALIHYRRNIEAAERAETEFVLDDDAVEELYSESLQYYHRRICYLEIEEWEAAVKDAEHNLQIMDLLRDHAATEEQWMQSEQHRAYVLAHLSRARAMQALHTHGRSYAIDEIEAGIRSIRQAYEAIERSDLVADSEEIRSLRDLQQEIEHTAALTPRDRLRQQLKAAVAREDFESAAVLRDRLKQLDFNPEIVT